MSAVAASSVAPKQRRTQAERREEAEKSILDAAVRLVAEKGLDGFTLAEVSTTYSVRGRGHCSAAAELIVTGNTAPRPTGVHWHSVRPDQYESIPFLNELRARLGD